MARWIVQFAALLALLGAVAVDSANAQTGDPLFGGPRYSRHHDHMAAAAAAAGRSSFLDGGIFLVDLEDRAVGPPRHFQWSSSPGDRTYGNGENDQCLFMLLCDLFLTTHMVNESRSFLQVSVLFNSLSHNASITRVQDLIGTIHYAGQKEVHLF